jgi:hypothetical protein
MTSHDCDCIEHCERHHPFGNACGRPATMEFFDPTLPVEHPQALHHCCEPCGRAALANAEHLRLACWRDADDGRLLHECPRCGEAADTPPGSICLRCWQVVSR